MAQKVGPWLVAVWGLMGPLEFRLASQGGGCGMGWGVVGGRLALKAQG